MNPVGVILSTFNKPCDLERVLAGYARQTWSSFELTIADDGSDTTTRDCINVCRERWRLPIKHVWQANCGFRKCGALNEAIRQTCANYLIFSDGDCIPHPEFIARHVSHAQPRRFISAGCIRLSLAISQVLSVEDVLGGRVFNRKWLSAQGVSHLDLRKLPQTEAWARTMNALTTTRATWNGHNSSAWRADVLVVNGFDQRMGYGGEDREFGERLARAGIRGIQCRYTLPCLHLEHQRPYRNSHVIALNKLIRHQHAKLAVVRTPYGILPEDMLACTSSAVASVGSPTLESD